MNNQRRVILVPLALSLICVVLLSGCATTLQSTAPPPDYFASKKHIGVIWVANHEDPTAQIFETSQTGGGLIGALLAEGIKVAKNRTLNKRLNEEKLRPLVQKYYLDLFEKGLEFEDFEVVSVKDPYVIKHIKKFKAPKGEDKDTYPEFDFRSIGKTLGVNQLLVLYPIQYGLNRMKGHAKGYSLLWVALIDVQTNKRIAYYTSTSILGPIDGAWNTPPDYTNLITAMRLSLETNVDRAYVLIFDREP